MTLLSVPPQPLSPTPWPERLSPLLTQCHRLRNMVQNEHFQTGKIGHLSQIIDKDLPFQEKI